MNLDFILLVASGVLIMMAIGASGLAHLEPTRRWPQLALYAMAQVLMVWTQLIVVDLGHMPGAESVKLLFATISVVFLFDFAGGSLHWFERLPRLRRVAPVAFALACLATVWQGGAAPASIIVAIAGSLSAGAAGFALLASARTWSAWGTRWRLRLIAAMLPMQVVTVLLTMVVADPVAEFSPLVLIAQLATGVLSLAVYLHNVFLQGQRLPPGLSRSWRLRRLAYFAAVWVVTLIGWFAAHQSERRHDATMRQQILARTALAAAAIDLDQIQHLTWTAADLGQPGYETLKRVMRSLRAANTDVRFALLAGLDHDGARFLVDSEPPDSPDYSPPGQHYAEAVPEYLRGMSQNRPFTLGPFTDRWGTWVIGSVPLLRLADGRRVNLELDVAATDWWRQSRRERLPAVLITMLIAVLMIGFFQAQERLREHSYQTFLSEQRMRAARDTAEAATRAKSDFLAVMSHELRTPLAGVIGMLDLLRRSPPAEARRQYIDVARDSAETLLRLLDDILDSAKIEAGRLTLEAIPFRPRDIFSHLCEAAHLRAEAKSVDFHATITDAVPEVLVGDPVRLRQVLGNLQNNALKFTEHGEVNVTIDARLIDAATVQLVIAVRDTGCGISAEHRQRLFGKFEQADRSITRRYGGTGLGLSIVKGLADTMGGTVIVDSEVGQGSTFTFSAPLRIGEATAVQPAEEAAAPLPPSSTRLSILCAEDDAVNRLVAEAVLTQLGHHVDFAENGELAIARLRERRYDLVLMDGRMPVLDGFRATRRIRNGDDGVLDPKIYICAATANVTEADRQRCLAAGMNDYVKKPLSDRTVAAALDRATAWLAENHRTPILASQPATPTAPAGLSEAELLAILQEPAPTASPSTSSDSGLDAETRAKLTAMFWHQAPRQLTELRAALVAGDLPRVGDLAHTLKSSAAYAGATELSRHFAQLESVAAAAQAHDCAVALAHAETEIQRLQLPSSPLL